MLQLRVQTVSANYPGMPDERGWAPGAGRSASTRELGASRGHGETFRMVRVATLHPVCFRGAWGAPGTTRRMLREWRSPGEHCVWAGSNWALLSAGGLAHRTSRRV